MAAILCIDFDDTIVLDNIARQLFEHFAAPGWLAEEDAYHRGEITVEQMNARAFALVSTTDTAEIATFVRSIARPRPGFERLYDWAHWHGWQTAIVSNGIDLYIDPVIADMGLDRVLRHSGRAKYLYQWRLRYQTPRGIEVEDGFKVSYAAAFRDAGDFVVYMGDGASDVEAARLAPVVFARSTLWDRLKDEHPRIYPFETFDEVREVLDREAESWLASFSSTTAAEGS